MSAPDRPKPLLIIDWKSNLIGPRYTEIGTKRGWRTRREIWKHTKVGFVLHYLDEAGRLVPFVWKTQRDIPRPPKPPRRR